MSRIDLVVKRHSLTTNFDALYFWEDHPLTYLIREATHSDLDTLLSFEQGIISAERPYDPTLKPDPISYYDIKAMIDSPDAVVIVAEFDQTIVASGYAKHRASRHYTTPETHAFLGMMYVQPEHRGKGVNGKVLDTLLDWARSQNLLEVHLTVYPENEAACRAYRKVGFEPYILEMRMGLDD
ncbi:MAG: GNAT family N-acetyltransferase [Pseudomonadota bacterium]